MIRGDAPTDIEARALGAYLVTVCDHGLNASTFVARCVEVEVALARAEAREPFAIERGARALAWLDGRDYVSPEDVQAIALAVMAHRLEHAVEGMTGKELTKQVLSETPVV